MRRVVITGGPGAGKTTLLAALEARGFRTVPESARDVISERLARGEPPRPDAETFAREILRRDAQKYAALPAADQIVFFDRSVLEAIAMLHEAAPFSDEALAAELARFSFEPTVFLLPPWLAIYRTDAERDHSFEHAVRVHAQLLRWYAACGYRLHEVPCLPVERRATHVLDALAADAP